MANRKSDFTLSTHSLEDLFSTQAERDDAKLERVKDIPLYELRPFKNHPFKIQNNDEMNRLIESIKKFGTIMPALARSLPEGGYELISGHRRLAACQVLGIETMPVIVREMTDDEAVIAMVDAQDSAKTKSSMRTLPLVGSFAEYFKEVKAAQELNKKVCGNCYNYEYDGYVFVDELGDLMRPDYLTSYFPQYI